MRVEFTTEIKESERTGTRFETLANHDEKKAKTENAMACHHCRFFSGGCDNYIGMWHKTCSEFEWW